MGRNVMRKPKKTSEDSDVKSKKKKSSGSGFKALVTEDGRDFIPLNEAEENSTDEEFEKMGLPTSYTPELTEDELDEEADEEEEEKEEDRVDWGKKLKNYYVEGSEEESDEEGLEDRIAEAREIADEMYENVDEEDAELDRYAAPAEEDDSTALDTLMASLSESLKEESGKFKLPEDFFALEDEEKREFLKKEHPEFLILLKEFKEKSELSKEQIEKLLRDPDSFKFCTKDGLEYLDIRNELVLMYVSYLTYYLLMKVHGLSVEKHPVIDRLLEIRILLEKTKPIENKFQYQISKLVNKIESKEEEENLGPKLENMEIAEGKKNIYKAPKNIINQSYSREEGEEDENNESYKFMKKMKEIEEYEMEHMRRIPMNKKYKKYMREMEKKQKNLVGTNLQDLTSFGLEKNKTKRNSNDLNIAAQKLRQSVIMSEKKNKGDMMYASKNGEKRKMKEGKEERGNPKQFKLDKGKEGVRKEDEVDLIKKQYKKFKDEKEKEKVKVRVYKPEEVKEGKREIGKNIMKNRGLVVKRSKTQGNARVTNRKKYEKKLKVYNAMTNKNRKEEMNYVGEETGINVHKKKSINA